MFYQVGQGGGVSRRDCILDLFPKASSHTSGVTKTHSWRVPEFQRQSQRHPENWQCVFKKALSKIKACPMAVVHAQTLVSIVNKGGFKAPTSTNVPLLHQLRQEQWICI